ncbi:MAG: nickel-dependent hydrogenase large subunit [Desulfovibrio sp.]|nr:nickel-dependent hydrogenase large subunit [Desulfovibrio sp.]MBI4958223.1 nickel-dependent hydrogenase large subunit [Desulfovibrio sp.]
MRTILPFGPQHPVLPEPIHLKLVVEDETVVEALPNLGYVHRGLEKLTDIRDYNQMVNIVERVCGICSCIHSLNYCEAVEKLLGLEVPQRAHFLRVMWGEIHRIHSHLLWLGLFADGFGFESLFMQFWRIRERAMDLMEATAGNRVVISTNIVGGVRKDITPEQKAWILAETDKIEKEVRALEKTILDDYTVKKRCCGKGVLTKEQAHQLGAVGPMLRGSGWAQDVRQTGYAAYGQLDFEPVVEYDGDSYARSKVRFREVYAAADLIRQCLAKLPEGEINTKVKGKPEGEVWHRVEQPRGELFYYIKGNGSKNLERVRIRTPTFANIPPLLAVLPGCELADVPVIVLSIDPCISCTER